MSTMPSRIDLSDEQIFWALAGSHGAIAPAAQALRVSRRTLERRLKHQPELRPNFAPEPLWIIAKRRTAGEACLAYDEELATDQRRLTRFRKKTEWQREDYRLEPDPLHPSEIKSFVAEMRESGVILITPKPQRR